MVWIQIHQSDENRVVSQVRWP